jgi:threonine aldolase
MRVEHAHSGVSVEELLANHIEGLRNRRGAPAWAFFPEKLSHAIDGAEGKDQGARYQVCVACHGQGLAPEDAALACGSRHSGVFRHHWRTGQRSLMEHVGNRHPKLFEQLREAIEDRDREEALAVATLARGRDERPPGPSPNAAKKRRFSGDNGDAPGAVDLRSDTVTRPSPAMREAMAGAEVGDDVFGDDPTVLALEAKMASVFGKEAAAFVPSGTMGNLVAVGVWCETRGSEFVCGDLSHIHQYEQGGLATLMGAHPRALTNEPDGTIPIAKIRGAIRPDDQHFPVTRAVCLENTHNKKGGAALSLEYVDAVGALCREHDIALHLDGARIWNAAQALGCTPARCVVAADSVSVCLSKGLGAPAGSVILGSAAFVAKCKRLRKACGGTMRQVGVLAAAALKAYEEVWVGGMIEGDHARLRAIVDGLRTVPNIKEVTNPDTNIAFAEIAPAKPVKDVVKALAECGVIAIPWVGNSIRIVTHRDIGDGDVARIVDAFRTACE